MLTGLKIAENDRKSVEAGLTAMFSRGSSDAAFGKTPSAPTPKAAEPASVFDGAHLA